MRIDKLLAASFAALSLVGCSDDAVYRQSKDFDHAVWFKDSMAVFDFSVADTAIAYDVLVDIRNTSDYPYENLWVFVNMYSPKGGVFRDTLDCRLADNNGRWIGKGSGSVHSLSVVMVQRASFNMSGNYRIELVQGMRADTLRGIQDVGIRILQSANAGTAGPECEAGTGADASANVPPADSLGAAAAGGDSSKAAVPTAGASPSSTTTPSTTPSSSAATDNGKAENKGAASAAPAFRTDSAGKAK